MPKIPATTPIAEEDFLASSLIYGVSRVGKTVLNASFPRPAIFTSRREGGYLSVQTMDRALWHEYDVEPLTFPVSNIKETMPYFREVEALIKSDRVRTIVFELSFYSDDVIRSVEKASEGGKQDGWAKYRLLDDHIQWLDAAAKRLGVRIAYNAIAADPGDLASKAPAGIQVAGKALARKLPATTDLTGYLRTEDRGNNQIDRVLHLVAYGAYPAGHRYGSRLPVVVRNPTYRRLKDLFDGRARAEDDGSVVYDEPTNGSPAADLPPL